MNAQPVLREIPLSRLRLSARNTRKSRTRGSIEAMSASLLAHGQLQNLTVEPAEDAPDVFEVIAGGTRLAGLQMLADAGKIPSDAPIPCRVVTNGEAVEASAAENLVRTRLEPAEEYDAFRAMADSGKSVEEIAAHFGVAEIVVKRSLKLANVDPQLFQIFREGHMRLEQLQALALTDDHEAQRKAWFVKQDHMRSSYNIREALTGQEAGSDNPLVGFVGAEAYEAAGGAVRRDLFSDKVYFGDKALLDKLAMDKLEAEAERYRAAGWSFVDVHLALDYEGQARYRDSGIEPKHTPPTAADRQRVKALESEIKRLDHDVIGPMRERIDNDEEVDEDEWDKATDERHELQVEARNLQAGTQTWSEDAKAKTGVVIWFDRHNGVRAVCGKLQPGKRSVGAPTATRGTSSAPAKAKKPQLSDVVLSALSAHRSAAAASRVAKDHLLATAILIDRLLPFAAGGAWHHESASRVSVQPARDHRQIAPDIDKALLSPLDEARKALKLIPRKDTLAWLLKQPEAFLQDTLASLVALSIDGITSNPKGHAGIDAIFQATGIDMAKHWTPACDGFLSRLHAQLVTEAVTEACGKEQAAKIATAKGKEGRAAEAAKLLAGTGWLPKPLRGPGYKTGKVKAGTAASPSAPAKASGKPAKPAKAKAPAKKATPRPRPKAKAKKAA